MQPFALRRARNGTDARGRMAYTSSKPGHTGGEGTTSGGSTTHSTYTVKSGQTLGGGLTYQNLAGNPAVGSATFRYATGAVDATMIQYVNVDNGYRVVETPDTTVLTNAQMDHITGTNLNRGLIRVRHANGVKITNVEGTFRSTPATTLTELPAGLQVESDASNVTVDSATFSGFQMTMASTDYWNGDGANWDSRSAGAVLRNVTANDNTDAGLDIKAPDVVLDNISASGNKRDVRLWAGCQCGTLTLGTPIKRGGTGTGAGLWLHSGSTVAKYVIQKLLVRFTISKFPIVLIDNGVNLTIVDCDIQAPAGTVLVSGGSGSQVSLGPNCHV